MAKIDLKSLSLKDLKALKQRVEKAIERHDKKAKADALSAIKAKAKEMGFSLDELTHGRAPKPAKKAKKPSKAAIVSYRDPANAGNTWGGRGPRPKWLRDALDAGKSLDDFKV
jgi:DNA-binding protein H-NS